MLGGGWGETTRTPEAQTFQVLGKVAMKGIQQEASEARSVRKKKANQKMNDGLKKGGAIAHQVVKGVLGSKGEFVPPTRTIAQSSGAISSDAQAIRKQFKEDCASNVFCLRRARPSWKDLQAKYGKFVPYCKYEAGA